MPTSHPRKGDKARLHAPKSFARDCFVVGVGASSGGLEACRKLLEVLPQQCGLAFILVQHLDPTHESMMVDLLANHTRMVVCQATEGMLVEVDHFYVIPPGTYLSVKGGHLRLSAPKARHGSRLPFDFLLQSLAEEYGHCAACVILSGNGADGSLGLRAIAEAKGLVIAQDPLEAQFDGMPRSAIQTAAVNLILPIAQIPAALEKFFASHVVPLSAAEKSPDLQEVIDLIQARTSQYLKLYKPGTVERRILRRMAMSSIMPGNYRQYLELLKTNPEEVGLLAKDMLIHVTSFFRDGHVFEFLEKTAIPALIDAHFSGDPMRVWIAGCSTGEETYSLAILLQEQIALRSRSIKLQIFASDIDPDAIAQAREGFYPASIEADLSQERLATFFLKEGKGYRIKSEIRASVVFTVQDILADPPFSRIDFVSCRNLLIYLRPEAQMKVVSLLRFSLRDGGLLLLGRSETVGNIDGGFEVVSKPDRLYRRVGRARLLDATPQAGSAERSRTAPRLSKSFATTPRLLADLCRRVVLDSYAPAAVLINARFECLYFLGATDRYLQMASGYASHDLISMIPQVVRNGVRSAVETACRQDGPVVVPGARVTRDGVSRVFNIAVQSVVHDSEKLLVLCFLDDGGSRGSVRRALDPSETARSHELEEELNATRRELNSAVRELQLSSEEQKAINDEALSVNEEYQSTNEELETSKEELQSLNEELTALNTQLQETLDRQRIASNDLQNVLYSTDVATLFLDKSLNIRFFTPATRALFNVIPSDVGRPIADLTSLAEDGELSVEVDKVLRTLEPLEREIEGRNNTWYIRRILPYRTLDNIVDGVVITFGDVTERRRIREALEAAKVEAERANVAKSRFLAAASHDLRQPLQTLTLIQGLLTRSVEGAKAQRLVSRFDETLASMSGMLNTLLDINQIEAGTVQAKISVVPVDDILRKLSDEFSFQAVSLGLEYRVVHCSLHVRTDPHLLEQMVRNLLSNAIKYTRLGRILLGCRRSGDSLRIEIWDTGIGIPASQLHAIFEEYHQVDNVARERSRGLGLGLSIVQRLGVLMGHPVVVESTVGKGSVFRISVPVVDRNPELATSSLRPVPTVEVPGAVPKRVVLLVEDEADVRDLMFQFLADEGYEVVPAIDGPDAFRILAVGDIRPPDLIVADFNLPNGIDGLQVAEEIRRLQDRPVPAIILTGDISTDTLQSISKVECVHLNKPVKLDEMLSEMRRLLAAVVEKPRRAISRDRAGQATIFVVDDDDQLRRLFREILEDDGRLVEDFGTSEAFLAAYRPDGDACLLIDAYLPGMGGLELLKQLRADGQKIPAIMITGNSDVSIAVEAMKCGASDFIEKPVGRPELLASIDRVLEQHRDSSRVPAWKGEAAAHIAGLTPRQREIMRLVLAGQPSKIIAADLGISQRTVENHRASIMKKTGSRSLPALARLAIAAEWTGAESDLAQT